MDFLSKPGPNIKYSSDMCDLIKQIAKEGGFHAAMIMACGISSKTFYRWKQEIPEFAEAVDEADNISLAFQEKCLIDGMLGKIKNYNFSANAMILNNKYRHQYTKPGSGDNTEITINTINLTPEQIDTKIAQKLEKLKSLGQVPVELINQIEHLDE